MFVFVVDNNQKPLMPTTPIRARRWIKSGKATPFWKKGVFCVRLNVDPSSCQMQDVAVGIDPGSKKEGFTVKSAAHTYLNINADAVTHVKDAIEVRRNMRRSRRFRKTPCRVNRMNRKRGGIPPSTRARWQWKLRICQWLMKLIPISQFVVEDIKAVTKGKRRWDMSFSPLEVGKQWFYAELAKIAPISLKQGWETAMLRTSHGLSKTKNKLKEVFEAHCVDSWCLANSWIGGHLEPDNRDLLCLSPIRLHRRQLHRFEPSGGIRSRYGGTMSLGLKRGSLVRHVKLGVAYVGGWMQDRISLHALVTGKRLTQSAKPSDCQFLTYNAWRHFLRPLKEAVSMPQGL